ncbi:MAG: HEAT repeat domain-containing protein [Thermogutta sp.]
MKRRRPIQVRSQRTISSHIAHASALVYFACCSLLLGCQSGIFSSKNSSKAELPPGIVLPQEKLQSWKNLAESARDPQQASRVWAQLVEALKSEDDPQLRVELLRIAARMPGEACLPLVELGLQDHNPEVQIQACRLAATVGAPSLINQLAGLARSATNQDVRQAAIKALGPFKDPAATMALGAVLQDRDPAVQYLAIRSLREKTGRDFGYDIAKWQAFVQELQSASRTSEMVAERERRQF